MNVCPFSPSQEAAEQLEQRTVGRAEILANVHSKLLGGVTSKAKPHALLVGPRGSGKSHVVEVALHRASQVPEFAHRAVVVRIPEDSYAVTRYSDLLAEAMAALAPLESTADVTEERIQVLLGPRVLVLVIENLDRVFADMAIEGQRRFRAWAETTGTVMILATAPSLFPGVADRNHPWFGGLATLVLPELTPQENAHLAARVIAQGGDEILSSFSRSPSGQARLKALATLTGGVPRISLIVSQVAKRDSLDQLLPVLNDLLESLVPYHQQLLWSLSPNERRLVVALARAGAMTVSQAAGASQIDQRTAAKTLGRLAEGQWVAGRKPAHGDRRNTYYRLLDPLLRLHLQYRQGPDQELEVLVTLVKSVFDAREQARRLLTSPTGSVAEELLRMVIGTRDPDGSIGRRTTEQSVAVDFGLDRGVERAVPAPLDEPDSAVPLSVDLIERAAASPDRFDSVLPLAQALLIDRLLEAKRFETLVFTLEHLESLDEHVPEFQMRLAAWRIGTRSVRADLERWEGRLGAHEALLRVAMAAAGDRDAVAELPTGQRQAFEALDGR